MLVQLKKQTNCELKKKKVWGIGMRKTGNAGTTVCVVCQRWQKKWPGEQHSQERCQIEAVIHSMIHSSNYLGNILEEWWAILPTLRNGMNLSGVSHMACLPLSSFKASQVIPLSSKYWKALNYGQEWEKSFLACEKAEDEKSLMSVRQGFCKAPLRNAGGQRKERGGCYGVRKIREGKIDFLREWKHKREN